MQTLDLTNQHPNQRTMSDKCKYCGTEWFEGRDDIGDGEYDSIYGCGVRKKHDGFWKQETHDCLLIQRDQLRSRVAELGKVVESSEAYLGSLEESNIEYQREAERRIKEAKLLCKENRELKAKIEKWRELWRRAEEDEYWTSIETENWHPAEITGTLYQEREHAGLTLDEPTPKPE